MASPKTASKGCVKAAMVGLGFAIIAAIVIFHTLSDPFHQLVRPPQLPDFAGPEQENFWSLQEKRLDLEATEKRQLKLSESEFNAYLSFLEYPPAGGICINRIKFIIKPECGTFYLLSSGFFMRSLIIRIDLSRDEVPSIMAVHFNDFTISASSIFFTRALHYLEYLLIHGSFNPVQELKSKNAGFTYDDQGITMTGTLIR